MLPSGGPLLSAATGAVEGSGRRLSRHSPSERQVKASQRGVAWQRASQALASGTGRSPYSAATLLQRRAARWQVPPQAAPASGAYEPPPTPEP